MKKMRRKAFKFRLKISEEVEKLFSSYSGGSRFLWNKCLAMNLLRLEEKQRILWYRELNFWLSLWKKSEEYSFLNELPSQTLQQKLKDLEKAFKDAFDKKQPLKRIPNYKRKGIGDSFRYPQGFKIDEKRKKIFLPKIGWVGYYKSRSLEGQAKNVTVKREGMHWYVSIQCEIEVQETIPHPSKSIVGIDMGIKRFATLSDGSCLKPLSSFKKLEEKLAKAQRRLSKKKKFSSNWKKQKRKITCIHKKIGDARKDYLQKHSTTISKSHAVAIVEDLQIKNISKSSKGTLEKPGKNVRAKSSLNRSILDQGWGSFVRMLEYKLEWNGGMLIKVPPHYTSQTCPSPFCGHKSEENRPNKGEKFLCVECGYKGHADHVGALNILARGHRVLACGEDALATSMKQELVGSSDAYLLSRCC